jgi:hypothetical protein
MVRKCRGCKQVSISADELLCNICEKKTLTTSVGLKYDADKPDLSLIPKEAMEHCARAFMYGAKLYGRDNYRKGMEWQKLSAAILRHITAWKDGEDSAEDSKVSHIGHALAGLSMLAYYIDNNKGVDNRPIKEVVNEDNKNRESSAG